MDGSYAVDWCASRVSGDRRGDVAGVAITFGVGPMRLNTSERGDVTRGG